MLTGPVGRSEVELDPARGQSLPPVSLIQLLLSSISTTKSVNGTMAQELEQQASTAILKAKYTAPDEAKSFAYQLPPASTRSTEEKTAYLSALRKSVTKMQDDINVFLTNKMEQDKASASMAGSKVDERKEEETYGEENVDDEG